MKVRQLHRNKNDENHEAQLLTNPPLNDKIEKKINVKQKTLKKDQ
jgi:hypothetical protein